MTRLSYLAIAALFVGSSALASPVLEPALEASQIIEKSGLTGLSYQARNLAQQAINDSQAPLGTQLNIVATISPSWGPEPLQQAWINTLENYSPDQRSELLRLLESPALARARSKEQQAIEEQESDAYQQYLQQLQAVPPTTARADLMRQLDDNMRFSALLKTTRQSIYTQLQELLSDWQVPADWQEKLQQDSLDFLFYVHRGTSNAELQRLVGIYQTPLMQTWLKQVERELPRPAVSRESVAAVR